MWIKRPRQEMPSVVNLENGHFIGVQSYDDTRGGRTWEIVSNVPTSGDGSQIVMDGYTSFEDAEAAFTELLSKLDITPAELDDPTEVKQSVDDTTPPADDDDEVTK